jgi:Arc/MetJ-type ribon-helix-helix transcriptional regulator
MSMAKTTRVTVTLPSDVVDEIDRLEKNRSSFVAEGVRRELERRRREALRRSLKVPHPESSQLPEEGLGPWIDSLPDEDVDQLVDPGGGTPVHWVPGEGWLEGNE